MLESLYSERVVQTYLQRDFPLFQNRNDDRLFKHITFFEEDKNVPYRISAVDHNNQVLSESSSVIQKRVSTGIPITDAKEEIFRVKAVLSEPDHGNTESYWVTQKEVDYDLASSHNQYRIRGISDKQQKSDWVYSELRDQDNDLIVYNMIHDILDVLITANDDQVEYLMEHLVSDAFLSIIQDKYPSFIRQLEINEIKDLSIHEVLDLINKNASSGIQESIVSQLGESFVALSGIMKTEFEEVFMQSPKESSELMRIYKVADRHEEQKLDFLSLVVESFIDDKYEKLIEKTDIEVLLQKDEEMGIYLNGSYDFNIKSELINAVYSASLDEHFVTSVNDAVQLIIDPVIVEELKYGKSEVVEKLLRIAMTEIYAPMQAIDQYLVELETELEDIEYISYEDSVLEMSTFDKEDYETRHMLMYDIIETVIKGDLEPVDEYHTELIDYVLRNVRDSRKSILIDYSFDEVIHVLLNVGESFRQSYADEFFNHSEDKKMSLIDEVNYDSIYQDAKSMKESFYTTFNEMKIVSDKKLINEIDEETSVSLIDVVWSEYSKFRNSMEESIKTSFDDSTSETENKKSFVLNELEKVIMKDTTFSRDTILEMEASEDVPTDMDDSYYNLFKHYLRSPNKFILIDKKSVNVNHNLNDLYLMDGSEVIKYALGDMDGDWPLGVFKLGTNTLKGEV